MHIEISRSSVSCLFLVAALVSVEALAESTKDDVRTRLSSPFHRKLLNATYKSVFGRVQPSGYFPESLTGAYPGMFPRTTGAFSRLFLETGESERAERVINYVLRAITENQMERMPHIIGDDRKGGTIRVFSDDDQPDGQAHLLFGWAMLALRRGPTAFEERTYPLIAKLMDRSCDAPYLYYRHDGWRIHPGLVYNPSLEHSRDGQRWAAYDFFTQSCVASALEHMIAVAKRRKDTEHVKRWSDRLAYLNGNIAKNMTREFEGKRIYLEMLLPTGRRPEPYEGMGWINLGPIPSGWKGADPVLFRNTIDTWHRVATIEWDGPAVTSSDWLPGSGPTGLILGKVLGWDMVYCMNTGQHERICRILDFLERVNTTELLAELFTYRPDTGTWQLADPGNGEQAIWWCWSMTVVRKAVGLPALPAN